MAIRARFICVNITTADGVQQIQLRATKQTDVANWENPLLWTEGESSSNTMELQMKANKNVTPTGTTFVKGGEVYVDFNPI